MRGAGASSTGSTAAITPVEDPAVAAQRRRAAALEALEWDGLMGSSPSTAEVTDTVQQQQQQVVAVPLVVTTLNGAAAAQTIGVLLRAHHPIRVATSAFHQAVEAGGWSSSCALLSAVLTRWASETHRTVVQRDLASSMDVPRPTLEQCKSVLHAFLCSTGSDTNQHRTPMQIAVRRGDFRTVHSLTSLLMERVGREHRSAAEHHHHHIAFPAAALQERSLVGVIDAMTSSWNGGERSLVGVIDAMTSSWNGGSGAFTSCAPLTAEALGHCLLSPTMSPTKKKNSWNGGSGAFTSCATKRLVIIGAGTPIRAEPLTTMESSLYVASTGADDDDGVNNQLDDDVASMCCNGNGDHPVVGATYHQMHHHMAAVRCRCWLMMSDIHQLLAICHRVE
ncbi:Hypothetical protein, putative [Bodo saltans]|uniref:Uncharacterized protein n=1 Tax=Bodo saltans TaxID=75058 RepID=A0A0S4JJ88_BODSA|nr:Hypothetical protein, putative [Bodo saltans]|eukprot:CUG88501.1 Hypothetical protein, putative [Bodo saltans]